ncbi:MAG TPA: hypothetical protein VKZ58_11950 [Longimicrobiales bacterium]|nr:hypothetical protein [Longimicrobiales bacterium]
MAEINPKVMEMVQEEVRKNPDISTTELFEKAKKLDKSIAELSRRAFHARYPLQVKRQLAPTRRRTRRRTSTADREAVRAVLLQLAKDLASAEDAAGVVTVVGGIDKYIDRIFKAMGRA